MIEIRYVQAKDKEFWYRLDKHLPEREFSNKVGNKPGNPPVLRLKNRSKLGNCLL